jgi:hypothetical protein
MNSCPIVVAQNSWRRRRSRDRPACRRAGVVSMTSAASALRRGTCNQPTVRSSVPVRRPDMPLHSATGAPVQPRAAVCRVSSGASSQSPCRQTECCRIADSARVRNPASVCSRGAELLLLEHDVVDDDHAARRPADLFAAHREGDGCELPQHVLGSDARVADPCRAWCIVAGTCIVAVLSMAACPSQGGPARR